MYEWTELIKLWEREQVTETQVIGQLLKQGEGQHALNQTRPWSVGTVSWVDHGRMRGCSISPVTAMPRAASTSRVQPTASSCHASVATRAEKGCRAMGTP